MDTFKCPECGGKLIEEGMSGIYSCSNCRAMIFKNDKGEYEIRKAHKVEVKMMRRENNGKYDKRIY